MDLLQIAGAVLILAAFIAAQAGALGPRSRLYLVLNLAGSALLTWIALDEHDWGFLMLEAVWAVVSAWGLVQVLRGGEPSAAH